MKIVRYSFLILIVFLTKMTLAHAAFDISEIMYDPSGSDSSREWVEIQNTGSDTLDLSKWYFFTDNTKHAITATGAATIAPSAYAIIAQNPAKFKADYPTYGGLLFDSSWTDLTNKGEAIALKDPNLVTVSPVTFGASSNTEDGYSLQKINGAWIGAKPTPGEINKESPKVVKIVTPVSTPTIATTTTVSGKTTTSKYTKKARSYGGATTTEQSTINLDAAGTNANSDSISISKSTLAWLGLAGVVVLGSGAMLLFHRKKSTGDQLTARDMTIVE